MFFVFSFRSLWRDPSYIVDLRMRDRLTTLNNDDFLYRLLTHTMTRHRLLDRLPILLQRYALEHVQQGQRHMRDHQETNQSKKEPAPSFKLGNSEEEEADGDFAEGEGDEDLDPVEEIVFEEAFVVIGGEVLNVAAEPVVDFEHDEAHANRVDHLCSHTSSISHSIFPILSLLSRATERDLQEEGSPGSDR